MRVKFNNASSIKREHRTMRNTLIACIFAVYLLGLAVSAEALKVKDMCGGTPSDGVGMSCPPGDYFLVRPLWPDGHCGDWVCCPANNDAQGSYNCEQGVPPTRSAISGSLKKLLGPRVTIQGLSTRLGTTKPVPGTTQRRGVEQEPSSGQEQETTVEQQKGEKGDAGQVEERGLSRVPMPGRMAPGGRVLTPGATFSALTKAECYGLGCKAVTDTTCPDVGALRERCTCKAGSKGVCIDAVK